MTTKKAIIIGTLCAIGATLTAYAIKKGIDIKPKTLTAVNADSLYTKKNRITTEALTDGWQFNAEPITLNDKANTFWNNPETITETKPTSLSNTSWTFKEGISFDSLNLEIGQTLTYYINFKAPKYNTTRTYNRIRLQRLSNGTSYYLNYLQASNVSTPAFIKTTDSETWQNENLKTIEIIDGNDVTTQNLIDFLWTNQKEIGTFLANKRYENSTTTYLGIEYIMLSQKTFGEGKVKNESLFFIKLQSTGITKQLYLEDAIFYTSIPNMEFKQQDDTWKYATYNAQFKMAKMTSMNINDGTEIHKQKGSLLNKYNSIQNKTNIYSVDAYVAETTMNQQQNITYTNETGTAGTATFGHATSAANNNAMWTIHQNTNIYTQGRANYVIVYYSCEVSNFQTFTEEEHRIWYQYLYQYVGVVTDFQGYGISSNPVTPPDIEDGNFMSLTGFILNILTLPFTFLSQAFNLTLWANTPWAFNIKNAIFVMIGIMTFIFIIKLFTRGFDSLGNYTGSISKNKVNRSQAKLNKEKAKLIKQERNNKEGK